MRQPLVDVLALIVQQTSPRFLATVRVRFPACVVAAFLLGLLPAVAFADPLKSDTPVTRTVSPAKPLVILPREPREPRVPRESEAKQQAKNFVSIGPIFGFTSHIESPTTGMLGLELSFVRYPYAAFGFGMGGFLQGQTVGFDHGRFAFGPQFNFMMFGVEVGPFFEEGSGTRATTVGVHASPFVSLGFFSAALRLAVPLGTLTPGEPYGIDVGLVCAIKMPVPLDGQLFGMAFH